MPKHALPHPEPGIVRRQSPFHSHRYLSSLKSALHEKVKVIDLVAQVIDDEDKEIMTMDLSGENLIPDELSRDSEGFMKCRMHKNQDGLEVSDTPTRDDQIMIEDDIGPEPVITLDAPEEQTGQ